MHSRPVRAVHIGAISEARVDSLTDEIARGDRSEADAAVELTAAIAPAEAEKAKEAIKGIPTKAEVKKMVDDGAIPLGDGEYIITNVTSRPELNGQVCNVSGSSFGQGMARAVNNARLLRTGELVSLHNDKLVPLKDAPPSVLYDEEDLALDEHPLSEDHNHVTFLKQLPASRKYQFAVRVHGLSSEAGQVLNGQMGMATGVRADGRVGVVLNGSGESRALKVANLMLAREEVRLPAGCAASTTPHMNAASRTAGDFHAADPPQPGFFVHLPPKLAEHAIEFGSAGWPGVYTDRRLKGVAEAPARQPGIEQSCGAWRGAVHGSCGCSSDRRAFGAHCRRRTCGRRRHSTRPFRCGVSMRCSTPRAARTRAQPDRVHVGRIPTAAQPASLRPY
jgi:hypothetical protein